ncbi:MAG: glycosyltransferase family 4 protein [Bacteroidetes bacterium]|nr:glycosyltransferase family 4 protein [Bacteroidota bacterium]MCW5896049.1 glycosyltransferase family 4 protein [Bacteroidota bacterium]
MKIGIDIRAAIHEPAGIGTLALNFARQLDSLENEDEYFLYGDQEFDFGVSNKRIHSVVKASGSSPISKTIWHVAALIDARYVRRLDAFVSFGSLQMSALTRNFVILVIPDLSHLLMPEFHVAKSKFTGRLLMRSAMKHAKKVVAISEHTKNDILTFMNRSLNAPDISVAYPACDDIYYEKPSDEDCKRVREKYHLHKKFILTVGTLEPRKNIPTLLKAFAFIAKQDVNVELVLAGKKGWLYDSIFAEIRSLGIESRVKFPGFVPLTDMPALYAMAEVFVYPSLYEGFGIPPLEAMSCGVPVITSNVSSLPEVTGDAAILVNPHDVRELAEQIGSLLNDDQLRKRYALAGRERAQRFSWKEFSRQILSAARA